MGDEPPTPPDATPEPPVPERRLPPIAWPGPHVMGLAPLDVWARLLGINGTRAHPRYIPRVAMGLATSLVGTVATLPERLLLAPVLAGKFGKAKPLAHEPGVVVILGYFRSGTTHLHYLLSCDPRFTTPSWVQAMCPQGFWASWAFFRFAMVPFLPNQRPQDDVAFGPDWPAEDDFALANWNLTSSLIGRLVYPSRRERFDRFHFLEGLSEGERRAWARAQAGFCWKITRAAKRKRLLLKTPSHTARVAELRRVFGERVKFVHITREPEAVIRSNAAMHERLADQLLEDPPSREETRRHIVGEYERTERKFLDESAGLPADRLCRIRYDDLIADPRATLEGIYTQLGLGWSSELDARFTSYLRAVADYRAAAQKSPKGQPTIAEPDDDERAACARLRDWFDHGPADEPRPKPEKVELPPAPGPDPTQATRPRRAYLAAALVALASFAAWMGIAYVTSNRLDTLTWIWGTFIGYAAVRVAGRGTTRLGVWCAACFLLVVGASVWPLPEIQGGWTGADRLRNIRSSYLNITSNWLYVALGAVAAYRFGSRTHIRPPGR